MGGLKPRHPVPPGYATDIEGDKISQSNCIFPIPMSVSWEGDS